MNKTKTMKTQPKSTEQETQISAPNMRVAEITIRGTAPYVQNNFSEKARKQMQTTQESGKSPKDKPKREPKDFKKFFEGAQHISEEGWNGIPASAFRNAMVRACSLIDFKMTLAKMAIFIEADGFDRMDRVPLVKITKGSPKPVMHYVRNATGVADLRNRPMWHPGWEAVVRIKFDGDLFKLEDIANLMERVGQQVGIGEGRAASKDSCGMGWGSFTTLKK